MYAAKVSLEDVEIYPSISSVMKAIDDHEARRGRIKAEKELGKKDGKKVKDKGAKDMKQTAASVNMVTQVPRPAQPTPSPLDNVCYQRSGACP